ncbi:osmoprotectant transport system substrate-binding protein [Streptosporangium becharense]|uniref:Osmoprotectant transport system substrate-binding protein n=1 Tax=Streptosporangium becharense TaxID=1816182 RepID=A0A7W9IJU8_9ACTN|nr:ABC transporter substrate-binding protein [Streptosporangium becharense]MBB2913975.1 osmoprotectant transport system substrate-binding protein [Streptosporangium becharense]MBB5821364.1 osmoprotectant transport system substrate-binding protein [Streptosporangium becharense]
MKRLLSTAAVILSAVFTLTACGGGDPLTSASASPAGSGPASAPAGGKVIVGSANFPENVLLAEIYAQALEAKGVQVERKLNIGSREVLYDQIKSGGLTVLPEYVGSLLAFVDNTSTQKKKDEVVAALKEKLPAELEILQPAAAEDNNSLTVSKETAAKDGLTTIEDLVKVAKNYTVGGPPEFKSRQEKNFKDTYGLEFKEWKKTGDATADAIKNGTVQVGNVFTTDPKIIINGLVSLQDTKSAFAAENITPLVNKAGVNDTVRTTLDAVSAKLDTAGLVALMKRIAVDKDDAAAVAKDWLSQNGLG